MINASYGIANQVGSAAEQFAQSVIWAFNPSIVKKFGANDMKEMFGLAFMSSRISFYVLYLMALPLLFEIEFVLKIWLKNVPQNAPVFCSLMLFNVLVEVLSFPLMTIAQASGRIKMYQFTNSLLLILNIPFMVIALKLFNSPVIGLCCMICMSAVLLVSRLVFLRRIASMQPSAWLRSVIFRIAGPVAASALGMYAVRMSIRPGVIRFVISLLVSTTVTLAVAWLCGLGREKAMALAKMRSYFSPQ